MKKSVYKLDVDYNIALNHSKTHLCSHLVKLNSLRDISDFMQFDSKLKESIKSVRLGMLSNHNNHINYNVYILILNELISNALKKLPVSKKLQKFETIKIIDFSTISIANPYFEWAEFRSTESGIKVHTKVNLNKGDLELIVVSNAKPHDRTKTKELITKYNSIYIFNKDYAYYKIFHSKVNTRRI